MVSKMQEHIASYQVADDRIVTSILPSQQDAKDRIFFHKSSIFLFLLFIFHMISIYIIFTHFMQLHAEIYKLQTQVTILELKTDGTTHSKEPVAKKLTQENIDIEMCEVINQRCLSNGKLIGEKGERGLPGVTGSEGPPGSSGPIGPPGISGHPGIVGFPGRMGEKGEPGEPGIVGPQGEKGDEGPAGTPGIDGSEGSAGLRGSSGLPGLKGEPGLDGHPGVPGIGIKGQKGEPGAQGEPGKPEMGVTPTLSPINPCGPQEFYCGEQIIPCIHQTYVCDGDNDCTDGLDEWPELCRNRNCEPDKFACHDHRKCLPRYKLCNGRQECLDGSDELECVDSDS